ncbi:extracellular solute-binding protein [Brachybacterium sacelli]|uniref:Multiple sugar transport system substrate-binding protein n=1 Tax=Brachybacterium sacelli TaxID=173364 RepID=A0ABS4WVZ8_9MICO|nr:extracellular solute-binding protein [Brachybacterium sacelli]MBP2380383.1 multiple sugar transport system substrate-binding protein [Brachybacterium sacelli]
MTLSRRTLLTASGAGAVGIGASACGSGGAVDPSESVDLDADPATLSGEIGLLTPDFIGDDRLVLDEEVIAPFVERTDISVSVDQVDWNKLNEKISTGIAGGIIADLIMTGVGWTQPFAEKGIFAEIPADFIESLGFDESVLSSTQFEGKYYSLPQALDLRFIGYHPDRFAERGITEPPTTLDELAQVAEELTGDDVVGLDYLSGSAGSARQAFVFLLYAFGGRMFSEDGLAPRLHEEPGRLALQWMLDLMSSGGINYNLRAAEGQPSPFQRDKAAMSLVATGNWPTWKTMTPELCEEGAVGMFLMPSGAGGDPVMFQGGTFLSISSLSENKDAAGAFMKHMLEPEILGIANAATGKVPPTPEIPENPMLARNLLTSFALENLPYAGAAEGGSAAYMEVRTNLDGIVESCLTKRSTVTETLEDMKSLCDDAISRL